MFTLSNPLYVRCTSRPEHDRRVSRTQLYRARLGRLARIAKHMRREPLTMLAVPIFLIFLFLSL